MRRLPGDVPVLSLEPRSVEDICASVEEVGAATGCSGACDRVAAAMRERIAADRGSRRRRIRGRESSASNGPIRSWSVGHWVPEMVESQAASTSSAIDGAPSRYVSWDEVLVARPEVMVLMPCG